MEVSRAGSVEIMRAHRIGASKEDANGKPIPRSLILKLLLFTDRDKILKAAWSAAVKMERKTIRFTPDYSLHTFKCRLAYSDAMDTLQKLDFRTFPLYPAKLKAIFSTPHKRQRISRIPSKNRASIYSDNLDSWLA